jgi:hypothetical protein
MQIITKSHPIKLPNFLGGTWRKVIAEEEERAEEERDARPQGQEGEKVMTLKIMLRDAEEK